MQPIVLLQKEESFTTTPITILEDLILKIIVQVQQEAIQAIKKAQRATVVTEKVLLPLEVLVVTDQVPHQATEAHLHHVAVVHP